MKSWKRPSELNLVVLNFVARRNVNFELGTHEANFGFDEERVARLSPERVWLRETSGKMERFSVESCVGGYHVYKARTPLVLAYLNERYWPRFLSCFCVVHFSVHFFHHHTRDSLRKGTLRIKGTVNRAQVAKQNYKKRRPVSCENRAPPFWGPQGPKILKF